MRIQTQKRHPDAGLALALEDGACYWFLHPWFDRLRSECGKYIDLYGDASFTRDDFPRLRKLLEEAEALTKQQSKTWQVNVGTELPAGKDLSLPAQREKLLEIIATWRRMIEVAEETQGSIECTGD